MEVAFFFVAIAMAMAIGAIITWQFAKWWFTSTTTAPTPIGRKRVVITFGSPLADTNVVRRATWVMSEVPKGIALHPDYKGYEVFVATSLIQKELVIVEGDVTPEQASRIIAWITQFAFPR
jgi:hypothetical protein